MESKAEEEQKGCREERDKEKSKQQCVKDKKSWGGKQGVAVTKEWEGEGRMLVPRDDSSLTLKIGEEVAECGGSGEPQGLVLKRDVSQSRPSSRHQSCKLSSAPFTDKAVEVWGSLVDLPTVSELRGVQA